MLYELLAGKLPFPGQTPAELLAQHLLAPVPRLPADRAAWQPLLDALLAKDPAARPADGAAVLAALRGLPFSRPAPARAAPATGSAP